MNTSLSTDTLRHPMSAIGAVGDKISHISIPTPDMPRRSDLPDLPDLSAIDFSAASDAVSDVVHTVGREGGRLVTRSVRVARRRPKVTAAIAGGLLVVLCALMFVRRRRELESDADVRLASVA